MNRTTVSFLVGLVAGVVLTVILVAGIAPGLMIKEYRSSLGLQESVDRIQARAEEAGWTVSSVMELEKSIRNHGGPEVAPVRLINLCQPVYSSTILLDDSARKVSVMMPCTISVYEKGDGDVYIGAMNAGLLGRLFGGVVADVMGGPVAKEQREFIASVVSG